LKDIDTHEAKSELLDTATEEKAVNSSQSDSRVDDRREADRNKFKAIEEKVPAADTAQRKEQVGKPQLQGISEPVPFASLQEESAQSAGAIPEIDTQRELLPAKAVSEVEVPINMTGQGKGRNEIVETEGNFQKALPRYEINPYPVYPEIARRKGQEGTVELEVLVLLDGSVGEVKLSVSSGFKSLDRAALKAIRYWQFKPARSYGLPVEDRVTVPVSFSLN
jgi:protein TonB